MNSPRISHLVHPTMSVVDRNLSITNEVRTIMTTTTIQVHTTRQGGLELLVSRLAVSMLRWSQHRTARLQLSHEQMVTLREVEKARASALDLARLGRLG
jgi:alkylated DNA repair dioxygenase AlkB